MNEIPFWEETYRNRDINTFPAEPNGTILEFEHLLKKDSAILEAGYGKVRMSDIWLKTVTVI